MTNREEIVGSVGVWPLKLLAKRCKGVPGVCYTAASVAECEGWDGNQDPMSPFERRKLETRICELEKHLESYEDQFYFLADALERAKTNIARREKQRGKERA